MKKEHIILIRFRKWNNKNIYNCVYYRVAFDDDDALLRITEKRERNRGKQVRRTYMNTAHIH